MIRSRRRRPTGLLLGMIAVAIGVGGALAVTRERPSDPVEALGGRVEAGEDAERFGFHFQRGGTEVLKCFAPNRAFDIDVDLVSGTTIAAVEHGARPAAVAQDQTVLLSRSLFEDPPFETDWLAAPALEPPPALRLALGDDLADYLFAADQPASGSALARAALDVADSVTELGPLQVDGVRADAYRVVLDPRRYVEAAVSAPSTERGSAADPPPRIDLAIDAATDDVLRITIRPMRPDGGLGPPEGGWTLQYHPVRSALSDPPDNRTELATIDATRLGAPRSDCRLGATDASSEATRLSTTISTIVTPTIESPLAETTTTDASTAPPAGSDRGASAGTAVFAVVVVAIATGAIALFVRSRRNLDR